MQKRAFIHLACLCVFDTHGLKMQATCSSGITIKDQFEAQSRDSRFRENFDRFGNLSHLRREIRVVIATMAGTA